MLFKKIRYISEVSVCLELILTLTHTFRENLVLVGDVRWHSDDTICQALIIM